MTIYGYARVSTQDQKLNRQLDALRDYGVECLYTDKLSGKDFNRPGYTIEAGRGTNPLPISQFDKIYADNLGILVYGAMV